MNGYYAHGVGPETIAAPAGWEARLKRLVLPPMRRADCEAVVWCLSLPDLLLAKLAAGRPHDIVFVEAAVAAGLMPVPELRRGTDLMPESTRAEVRERLDAVDVKLARRTQPPPPENHSPIV